MTPGEEHAADMWATVVKLCGNMRWQPFPPITLRELMGAAEEQRIADWDHTAEIIANLRTAIGGQSCTRDEVHPFREFVPVVTDPGDEFDKMMREHERDDGIANVGQKIFL